MTAKTTVSCKFSYVISPKIPDNSKAFGVLHSGLIKGVIKVIKGTPYLITEEIVVLGAYSWAGGWTGVGGGRLSPRAASTRRRRSG